MILYFLYWWKYERNGLKTVIFCVSFQFPTMFYSIVGAGAVEPEPEPHRVTAPDPAPTKRCGSLRLRLRNTGYKLLHFVSF
jgi:hypothetical protein